MVFKDFRGHKEVKGVVGRRHVAHLCIASVPPGVLTAGDASGDWLLACKPRGDSCANRVGVAPVNQQTLEGLLALAVSGIFRGSPWRVLDLPGGKVFGKGFPESRHAPNSRILLDRGCHNLVHHLWWVVSDKKEEMASYSFLEFFWVRLVRA